MLLFIDPLRWLAWKRQWLFQIKLPWVAVCHHPSDDLEHAFQRLFGILSFCPNVQERNPVCPDHLFQQIMCQCRRWKGLHKRSMLRSGACYTLLMFLLESNNFRVLLLLLYIIKRHLALTCMPLFRPNTNTPN